MHNMSSSYLTWEAEDWNHTSAEIKLYVSYSRYKLNIQQKITKHSLQYLHDFG